MKCPKCDAEFHLGDKFCKACGYELKDEPEAPAPAGETTAADRLKGAKVEETTPVEEKDLWEGRYSILEGGLCWILCALLMIAVVVVYLLDVGGLKQNWFLITGVCVAAVVFLWSFFSSFWRHLTNKYKVTTQRIFYIQGFLSRTTDELEIIRVDDVQYRQNLTERVFGLGRVVVIAPTDRTHGDARGADGKALQGGQLELAGVSNPEEVKELIRKYARMRREKGALFVEQV